MPSRSLAGDVRGPRVVSTDEGSPDEPVTIIYQVSGVSAERGSGGDRDLRRQRDRALSAAAVCAAQCGGDAFRRERPDEELLVERLPRHQPYPPVRGVRDAARSCVKSAASAGSPFTRLRMSAGEQRITLAICPRSPSGRRSAAAMWSFVIAWSSACLNDLPTSLPRSDGLHSWWQRILPWSARGMKRQGDHSSGPGGAASLTCGVRGWRRRGLPLLLTKESAGPVYLPPIV
jgi:hypothetical protein